MIQLSTLDGVYEVLSMFWQIGKTTIENGDMLVFSYFEYNTEDRLLHIKSVACKTKQEFLEFYEKNKKL